jgi:hypothetical protein
MLKNPHHQEFQTHFVLPNDNLDYNIYHHHLLNKVCKINEKNNVSSIITINV